MKETRNKKTRNKKQEKVIIMTRKEQNIILDRLNKLQLTVDYNNDLYRQTGDEIYNTYADLYRAMLFGVRGIAIELGLVGKD
jgi:hypothetical protein